MNEAEGGQSSDKNCRFTLISKKSLRKIVLKRLNEVRRLGYTPTIWGIS